MPKLLKMLQRRKASSGNKKSAIFRSKRSTTTKKDSVKDDAIAIVPTITFSLSEDEESDVVQSPVSDIENQFQEEPEAAEEKSTKDVSVGTDEDNESMTFTHLEIMRNQLSHMMELAQKDKEINALMASNEEMKFVHAEEMAKKEAEILKLREALSAVEAALSKAEGELTSVHNEQSKTIEVLMKTQYELHELKLSHQSSWNIPFMSYFDFN
jgi:hypothetical protein